MQSGARTDPVTAEIYRTVHGPVVQFDEAAIYRIRRIEYLRAVHGINLAGIKMIFDLLRDVEHLRAAYVCVQHRWSALQHDVQQRTSRQFDFD